MRLDLHTKAFFFNDRKKFFHGTEPHTVADLCLVRITGKLGIDHRNSHVYCDLDHFFPIGNCKLTLLLCRAGPAVDTDEGRNLHAGLTQRIPVFHFTFLRKKRMLVKRIDPGVRRLFNIFVTPVSNLVDHTVDIHLFCQNIYIKCNFHVKTLPISQLKQKAGNLPSRLPPVFIYFAYLCFTYFAMASSAS